MTALSHQGFGLAFDALRCGQFSPPHRHSSASPQRFLEAHVLRTAMRCGAYSRYGWAWAVGLLQ